MFDRAELKREAKLRLAGVYFNAVGAAAVYFAVCLIISCVLPGVKLPGSTPEEITAGIMDNFTNVMSAFAISGIVSFIAQIFIVNPIAVGLVKYFMENDEGRRDYKNIFFAFRQGYVNIVLTKLLYSIYIMLWSLLFIVPGIVKSYQYYMIDFILAENPHSSMRESFAKSKEMTRGIKADIFIFDLSFLPWVMLGMFAGSFIEVMFGGLYMLAGAGMIFVNPYIIASKVRLYKTMRYIRYGSPETNERIII